MQNLGGRIKDESCRIVMNYVASGFFAKGLI